MASDAALHEIAGQADVIYKALGNMTLEAKVRCEGEPWHQHLVDELASTEQRLYQIATDLRLLAHGQRGAQREIAQRRLAGDPVSASPVSATGGRGY